MSTQAIHLHWFSTACATEYTFSEFKSHSGAVACSFLNMVKQENLQPCPLCCCFIHEINKESEEEMFLFIYKLCTQAGFLEKSDFVLMRKAYMQSGIPPFKFFGGEEQVSVLTSKCVEETRFNYV